MLKTLFGKNLKRFTAINEKLKFENEKREQFVMKNDENGKLDKFELPEEYMLNELDTHRQFMSDQEFLAIDPSYLENIEDLGGRMVDEYFSEHKLNFKGKKLNN
jgi:hypothetical protein